MPKKLLPQHEASKLREIDTYTHDSTRPSIPPAGLARYDTEPDTSHTYSFDPHLSPSLDWAGKTESSSLTVPTSSIHVHEAVKPHKILLPVQTVNDDTLEQQLSLFPEESPAERIRRRSKALEFYRHRENWTNRMIAGDSLVIMNSLLQKEGMSGTVQTAYIDPPYGIKYGSNFQPFVNKRDVKDRADSDLTGEPEMIKAFRDTWELGIHSYLTYLRNRLLLVRELLRDEGSVFVQISDENVHFVRCLCDEVFGVDNFVSMIPFRKKLMPLGSKTLEQMDDFLVWYAKDKDKIKYHQLYKKTTPDIKGRWTGVYEGGKLRRFTAEERKDYDSTLASKKVFATVSQWAPSYSEANVYEFEFEGEKYYPAKGHCWITSRDKMQILADAGRLFVEGGSPRYVMFHDDFPYAKITAPFNDTAPALDKRYVVQTNPEVIARCILMTSDPGDLVLDITCGSGTTAYVAEQWGRRWITCDTSRVALAIARQRLLTATYDYYKLEYPERGISGGFVYRKVPHVTLKSIANGEPPATETLYDSPETDRSRVRITGPFTVEALPAPVVLSPEEAMNYTEDTNEGPKQSGWREQLLSTGILARNGERIRFSRLEAMNGTRYLNAVGETDEENPRRAIVCFANETTLMDSRRVNSALDEAEEMRPVPELIVFAAFQFDPVAQRTIAATKWAGVRLLQVQMNPDLMTGDLKKNVKTDQSFFLVGQPDVEVVQTGAGRYKVRVIGFDYYNVNSNEVESGEAENIAMWLLDTNYDGMSLEPSQVFFPGNGWEKLGRTLRAEIDAEMMGAYSGNESLEFTAEEGQRIAVKIIDDRGIESMRVITL